MGRKYNAIYDAVHDLKKIIPLLYTFIDTKPKPHKDMIKLHDKIVMVINNVMVDLCKCLETKPKKPRPEPQGKDGTLL